MSSTIKKLLPALVLLMSTTVMADSPDFTNLELSYRDGDYGPTPDNDADGWRLDGSFAFNDDFFIEGYYGSNDLEGSRADLDSWGVGAGYILTPGQSVVWYATLGYRKEEVNQDFEGFGFGGGVRANISDDFELAAELGYYFGDYDGSFHYDLGGAWNVNERFAVTVGFEKREVGDTSPSVKLEQIYVGGRLNF